MKPYEDGNPEIITTPNLNSPSCIHSVFYDNGYLYGYYCEETGSRCDMQGIEFMCSAFKNGIRGFAHGKAALAGEESR